MLVILFLIAISPVFSQSQNYDTWEIVSASLSGGKVVINANETRVIKFRVTAKRQLNPSGNPNEWLPVNFQFQLARMPSGAQSCGCTAISNIQTITSADFGTNEAFVTKEYSVSVTAQSGSSSTGSALRNGDRIVLVVGGPWAPSKAYSVTVNIPPSVPAAPTNLTISAGASCKVDLSWTKPSGTVTGYKIYVNDVYNQSLTSTSTTISNLNANTTYALKVTAYNSLGESPKSTAANYTTSADPIGTSLNNPINVTLQPQQFYYDARSNVSSNCYRNDLDANGDNQFTGQPSDDVYYKFYSQYSGELQISLCGSSFTNTRIHLLKYTAATWVWVERDINERTLCASLQTSRVQGIEPGTYAVVIEGDGSSSGTYNLSMILDTRFVPGSAWYIPIDAGVFGSCTNFYDNKPWINPTFIDNYGGPGDDVYYKFSLSTEANIVIAACNDIHDFRVHLLNNENQLIMDGNVEPCYISTFLPAGNYKVIVEGEPDSYPHEYNLPVSIWTSDCFIGGKSAANGFTISSNETLNSDSKVNEDIKVFPIPAREIVIVEPEMDHTYGVKILDMSGTVIRAWNNLKGSNKLDIINIKKGIYIIEVKSLNRTLKRRIELN